MDETQQKTESYQIGDRVRFAVDLNSPIRTGHVVGVYGGASAGIVDVEVDGGEVRRNVRPWGKVEA